jgi:hypothetical protein
MEIIQTETNKGNKAILVEGILYQKKNVLKNGDIVYVCSAGKYSPCLCIIQILNPMAKSYICKCIN